MPKKILLTQEHIIYIYNMKYYLSTFAGSAICGGFAFGIWPELWKTYGLMGGWLAATLIIGIMWYMNHYNGAILNPPGKIWLDQGWCIGSAGIAWGIVRFQETLPISFMQCLHWSVV